MFAFNVSDNRAFASVFALAATGFFMAMAIVPATPVIA
ncbi:recombination protein F [Qipengyuania sp. 1NDW9]|uniref:Recombination protein F n=2 Tax=Qipengyuania TaxID=1855416 RepID=A0A9Q3RZA1_9SPHN|nr:MULTISPECIES: recombination protein F [Qipengyuania]MBX7493636.1 recombination protein F [Qipengyuania xiapuensis]MBY6129260.1 recombination protein F [Qipengyuania aquimaris]MBY6217198.1 recombination protein F [Qipengyuania aquimaris]QZD92252.1 recombination protein F [Qipengyuania xiapuensis]UOR14339.1 recombination protein F [Qipengyuania aquimaris]